jgi:predicted glycoside hydrolase/deacetylase ChbG (UPF0249 family)
VFLHADDVGGTPTMTERLCRAWSSGLLDGFSVFGNCTHPELVRGPLMDDPDRPARIAVHLNLWEGRPVGPAESVPRLVDRAGFLDVSYFRALRQSGRAMAESDRPGFLVEIETEWRAQVDAVARMIAPRTIGAVDSHLHMHMIPGLFLVASRIAADRGIPEIRIVHEPFYLSPATSEWVSVRLLHNEVKRRLLASFVARARDCAAAHGLGSPDRMLGVLYSGMMSRANIAAGVATARSRGAQRIEVLVHPGRAVEAEVERWNGDLGKAAFALSPARDTEHRELGELRGTASVPRRGDSVS